MKCTYCNQECVINKKDRNILYCNVCQEPFEWIMYWLYDGVIYHTEIHIKDPPETIIFIDVKNQLTETIITQFNGKDIDVKRFTLDLNFAPNNFYSKFATIQNFS